jgi:ATP-dependent 26S proteasome regulatory subunit
LSNRVNLCGVCEHSAAIACFPPHIRPYTLDLSDSDEKNGKVLALFEKAAENAPALVILEDLDRAFPTEGKRTQERTVSFQTLLNCLDGVGSQDGIIVVATANDPTCLDPAILKRPGRFDRVVQFRNPETIYDASTTDD